MGIFGKKKVKHIGSFREKNHAIKQMVEAGIMLDNWYLERKKKELELKVLESQIKDSKPKEETVSDVKGLETSKA